MQARTLSRWERVALGVILLLAVFSRFYILGDRVMSHDEALHTKFSWYLYSGSGYRHNPMMHGPLLFHMTALNYFLFGVNDFVARIFPAALGVLLVLSPFLFRRWLGRGGALIASLMLLISPAISYYNRYIRHDTPNMLMAVLLLWAILKYLEEGRSRWLYAIGAFFALLYTTKETCYIYTLIYFVLLVIPFILNVLRTRWARPNLLVPFLALVVVLLVCVGVYGLALTQGEVVEQALDANTRVAKTIIPWWGNVALYLALVLVIGDVVVAYFGVGEATLRRMRLFDVLMLVGTLTLPLGSAFLIQLAGVDMMNLYSALTTGSLSGIDGASLTITAFFIAGTLALAAALGWWWGQRRWLTAALIAGTIFTVLYTTIFTNPVGLLSGLVGSLAYWMAQQGVQRGTQPGYYYLLLMPLYEYLPLVFSLLGAGTLAVGGLRRLFAGRPASTPDTGTAEAPAGTEAAAVESWVDSGTPFVTRFFPLFALGWTALAWIAYTYAGEKMPWLTVHIALPSIFLAAWFLGRVAEGVDWRTWWKQQGWVLAVALPLLAVGVTVFVDAAGRARTALSGGLATAGPALAQLDPLFQAVGGFLGAAAALAAVVWAWRRVGNRPALRVVVLTLAAFLALLTVRTMTMFNYVTYDLATEFLVYAHGAPDVKIALRQIEDVSWRTTGSPRDVKVAYGEREYTIFSWYLHDFPNAYYYGQMPDPVQLRESPVVIAGSPQWAAVEAILGDDYQYFSYKFLWWPLEDYRDLTWQRIKNALTKPDLRQALWDIAWKRDYRRYAQVKGRTITLQQWPYRDEFRLYVRRDLAEQIWGYRLGSTGAATPIPQATPLGDPYAGADFLLTPAVTISLPGATPRDVAAAPDGSLYVTDTQGQRIWHVSRQGAVLNSWGGEGSGPGQFREPWGVVVDAEGNVYVADTWNHRIQKFSARGEYLSSWGALGQFNRGDINGEGLFYGPRALAVGSDGYLYVTDTGNKRVQVFDRDGHFLWEFGGAGRDPGELHEPVGLAFNSRGEVVLADSWNLRMQVLLRTGVPVYQWSVPVWSVENSEDKPYVAVDAADRVFVSDSSHGRVLIFDAQGVALGTLGMNRGLQFPAGLALTADGQLFVADPHAGTVVGFTLADLGL